METWGELLININNPVRSPPRMKKRVTHTHTHTQGDQKVSVHVTITVKKYAKIF
jgi:hypothetical protein